MDKKRGTDNRPLILVTGASGAVGPAVVDIVLNAGYRVRTLSVDPLPDIIREKGVEDITGDVTNIHCVRQAMKGVKLVVHLAGLLHISDASSDMDKEYERVNVGGTATVVSEALKANASRIVFFSTIAVYGKSNGRIMNEDTPPQPNTCYAKTKLSAEKIVLGAKGSEGRPIGVVLRLGAIYGPEMKGNYLRLVRSLARGRFLPVGSGKNRRTLVYDKDAARAAVLAVEHPKAPGKIFNVSDGKLHTVHDILLSICRSLGKRPPVISLPAGPARIAATVVEQVARCLGGRSPVNRVAIDKYIEDIAVESRRISDELGFVPRYGLEEGWKETVKTMRISGDL